MMQADLSTLNSDNNDKIIQEVAGNGSFVQELWDKSIQERDKGWSQGPFRLADLPEDALISKRFGVQQGHELRPIDDLSQSLINMAFESHGKVHVHDADVITAALLMFRRLRKGKVYGKTLGCLDGKRVSLPYHFPLDW